MVQKTCAEAKTGKYFPLKKQCKVMQQSDFNTHVIWHLTMEFCVVVLHQLGIFKKKTIGFLYNQN